MRKIRHATVADVDRIMQVLDAAKQVMRNAGNENQWINGYPTVDAVLSDIERQGGMVVEDDGVVVAYFALAFASSLPMQQYMKENGLMIHCLIMWCIAWVVCPLLAAYLRVLWIIVLSTIQTYV